MKTFEKFSQKLLECQMLNAVTYNKAKIEALFLFELHQERWNKQLQKVKIKIGNKISLFNKKAM